jgi:FMN-dependent NADH-azoreductase
MTTKLLQIQSSLWTTQGQSSQLADYFVQKWLAKYPETQLVQRDLSTHPVPHLDQARFMAFLSKPEDRTPEQQDIIDFSDALIEEIKQADIIVLGLPMYNFGIPSTLKAYFDHITRAGVTFRYTAEGAVGLLPNKQVYVLAARGGEYVGTPLDTQTRYIQDFLHFIGIDKVDFVYAEGLNMGEDKKQKALARAHQSIDLKLA